MRAPRFMLAAPSSASGKTVVTCLVLEALVMRGLKVSSFKCGPDYIDPMFHSRVIGTRSRNLDLFFTDDETTRYLLTKNAAGSDISVIEGVMGYYDGLGGISEKASSYDLARATRTDTVLIVNTKGMSLSVLALIRGFLSFREDSRIKGVILNRMSPMLYPEIRARIEAEFPGLKVYGYVPEMKDIQLESRHLGLVMPGEVQGLQEMLRRGAERIAETVDLDDLIELANHAEEIEGRRPDIPNLLKDGPTDLSLRSKKAGGAEEAVAPASEAVIQPEACRRVRVALAHDEAFCFEYADNQDLLREMGADLIPFSPIHDEHFPENVDGCLLYGGYPELYAKELTENRSMISELKAAICGGLPTMAECGGFMYLLESMEDMDGVSYPMAGVLSGRAFRTPRLTRFGYISLSPNPSEYTLAEWLACGENKMGGEKLAVPASDLGVVHAHEFHYFDSTDNGDAFHASKPLRKRSWDCVRETANVFAGFPHLYYYSNPKIPEAFLRGCLSYRAQRKEER